MRFGGEEGGDDDEAVDVKGPLTLFSSPTAAGGGIVSDIILSRFARLGRVVSSVVVVVVVVVEVRFVAVGGNDDDEEDKRGGGGVHSGSARIKESLGSRPATMACWNCERRSRGDVENRIVVASLPPSTPLLVVLLLLLLLRLRLCSPYFSASALVNLTNG